MLKKYLRKFALVILNLPFSLGLLMILFKRLEFDTPGYWVMGRLFPHPLSRDLGWYVWTGLGIDFVLCFAAVWILSLLFLRIIQEVEK